MGFLDLFGEAWIKMVGTLRISLIALLFIAAALFTGPPANASNSDYLGVATPITPFDSQYRRVRDYLEAEELGYPQHPALSSEKPEVREALRVFRKYLKIASRFKYVADARGDACRIDGQVSFSPEATGRLLEHWQLPEETEGRRAGDCEDKAIWLYVRLIQRGFENTRLVIGKYRINQSDYHAWVAAYLDGKVYILDPTTNNGIWEAQQYPEGFYVPIYSYHKNNRWRHGGGLTLPGPRPTN